MTLSLNNRGGELFSNLFENIISLLLLALNVTFQVLAQEAILPKSLFNCFVVSVGSFPLAKREQSSAKVKISLS